jgi:hypothetical protein
MVWVVSAGRAKVDDWRRGDDAGVCVAKLDRHATVLRHCKGSNEVSISQLLNFGPSTF